MHMNKGLALRAAVVAAFLVSAPHARGAAVAGVTLPATEAAGGTALQLAGCATREELWTNLYTVSLYLPQPGAGVAAITDDRTAKVVRIDVTYDGQVPDGLPATWKQGLQAQVSGEFLRTLQGLYNNLQSGDTVRVAYAPGSGSSMSVNGRVVATQPGGDLVNAMLRLWIGLNPVSENVKRLLLEGRC